MLALRDIGNNSYGVFGKDDKIEYLGSTRQDAYNVYLEFLKYVDGNIAKLIFGQDVVTNNTGQVVGEVGENVSNMYGDTDAKMIARIVNSKLIPLMENLGMSFEGHCFEWDNDEKLTMTERKDIDASIVKDMGKRLTDEYVEQTYGVLLDETPEEDVDKAVEKTYAK
jgi:phage gp29-like protein